MIDRYVYISLQKYQLYLLHDGHPREHSPPQHLLERGRDSEGRADAHELWIHAHLSPVVVAVELCLVSFIELNVMLRNV